MASELKLSWEWPNDRVPSQKLAVKIEGLKPYSPGFFGLKKSPSFVSSLPDPMELVGTVVAGEAHLVGKRINLVLPKLELGDAGEGDIVALGVLDEGVSICLEPIPASEQALDSWLEQWRCTAGK